MTEVRFYHMTRSSLEAALPQMLEKTLERGQKAVVMAGSPARVEALNDHLWSYSGESFLPHGSAKDGFAERQPVWLTLEDERPNAAEVLFLTDGATSDNFEEFKSCVVLFDGKLAEAVQSARRQWVGYRDAGHQVTYWQQDEEGRWSQKN